jgi:hypothetical protein
MISMLGKSPRAPGLHLADRAVLPRIPAKFTTLAIMADADRIGGWLAQRP